MIVLHADWIPQLEWSSLFPRCRVLSGRSLHEERSRSMILFRTKATKTSSPIRRLVRLIWVVLRCKLCLVHTKDGAVSSAGSQIRCRRKWICHLHEIIALALLVRNSFQVDYRHVFLAVNRAQRLPCHCRHFSRVLCLGTSGDDSSWGHFNCNL